MDAANTIAALKKAFELAKKADDLADTTGTSLFTDTIECPVKYMIRNYEFNNTDSINTLLNQPEFDYIRDSMSFKTYS